MSKSVATMWIIVIAVCQFACLTSAAENSFQRTELVQLQQTFLKMVKKVRTEIARYNHHAIPLERRNLVVFHINEPNIDKDSMDVAYNNLQVFVSSVLQHSEKSTNQAFYIFNDAGGPMADLGRFVPSDLDNVAHIVWPRKCSEKDTPLKTVLQLGSALYTNFSSIIVTSDRSRGPMIGAKNGAWIGEFRTLLDQNNVGAVGASFSCDPAPHVQPHMYAMRMDMLAEAANKFAGVRKSQSNNVISFFQDSVSAAATKLNYRVASLLHYTRDEQVFFDNKCLSVQNPPNRPAATANPMSWCDLTPEEVVFVKWGGVPLRPPSTMCEDHIDRVLTATAQLAVQDPQMQLHFPEIHHRTVMYEIRKQYTIENWRSRNIQPLIVPKNATSTFTTSSKDSGIKYATALVNPQPHMVDVYRKSAPKVCFLVKVMPKYDSDPAVKKASIFARADVEETIQSLLRQTNPNWRALFTLAGPNAKFFTRMEAILGKYEDARLTLLSGHSEGTSSAAELDHLTHELESREDCAYGTVTSGDNIYGSEVVQNILFAHKSGANGETSHAKEAKEGLFAPETEANVPRIVFVPYDSRANAEYEMVTRNSLRNMPDYWLEQCISFDAMFAAHMMPYTVQPNVLSGRVELSGVFLLREALLADKIKFASVVVPESVALENHCTGCESAVLIQHLLRVKQWTSVRLPIDGMKSVVFEGPSPTLCVAAGNVWFDYPDHAKTGCIDQETLKRLQLKDSRERPYFDWKYSFSRYKVCLRLSEHGFANKADIFYS